MAGDAHSRPSALACIRHLRRISIRRADAGNVFSVRHFCVAVAHSPWQLEFLLRTIVAHRPAVCVRCLCVDADRLLSGLSRYRRRSELAGLLAALDRVSVLAPPSPLFFLSPLPL